MDIDKLLPLVEKAIDGDKQAYSDLCEEIIRDVLYVCIKITGDVQHGEDAAQEALARLGSSIRRLRNPHAFPLWLGRHLAGSCRDYLRRERRHAAREIEGLFEEIMEDNIEFLPQQWAEKEDARQMVLDALQRLPAKQQHLLLMYYFQNMSVRDIAQVSRITESTVRSKLQYARGNLKKQIEKAAGTQLAGLPAATVPTITQILRLDAARLVREESAKRVLLAVGASLAGGVAGAAAGAQLATLAASFAPAVVALMVVAATLTPDSSPSPAPRQEAGIGVTPQYSDTGSRHGEEGEGGLYIPQPPDDVPHQPESSSATLPPPAADGPATQPDSETPVDEPTAPEAAAFEAEGRVALADEWGTPADHPALRLNGFCVQAWAADQLVNTGYTDERGRYTLRLPDDGVAYTIRLANNTLPRTGQQDALVTLGPGEAQAPTLWVSDTVAPVCAVAFLDEQGEAGDAQNPHSIAVELFDATPCSLEWQIARAGAAVALHTGSTTQVPVAELSLPAGRYTLCLQATDLCGNTTQSERVFYIR